MPTCLMGAVFWDTVYRADRRLWVVEVLGTKQMTSGAIEKCRSLSGSYITNDSILSRRHFAARRVCQHQLKQHNIASTVKMASAGCDRKQLIKLSCWRHAPVPQQPVGVWVHYRPDFICVWSVYNISAQQSTVEVLRDGQTLKECYRIQQLALRHLVRYSRRIVGVQIQYNYHNCHYNSWYDPHCILNDVVWYIGQFMVCKTIKQHTAVMQKHATWTTD